MKKIIEKYNLFIRYLFSAGICFGLDLILFTIFNYFLKDKLGLSSIFVSTLLARIITSCLNYYLNRNKVFRLDNNKFDLNTFVSYVSLVIIQMLISSVSVTYIYKITGINETVIKFFVDIVLFIINFFIQKLIIFKKDYKPKNNIVLLLYAVLSSLAFLVNPVNTTELLKIDITSKVLVLSIITTGFYLLYKKNYNNIKYIKEFKLLSFIFTLFMIFGYSFYKSNSPMLVYSNIQYILLSIVKLFGYYISINFILNYVYYFIESYSIKPLKSEKVKRILTCLENHPFKTSFIFLLAIYLIYFISFYPGVVGYDPSYQINEVMGIPTFYTKYAIFTNDSLITQFNPVLHTLLIGNLFKFGHNLGYDNLGIAIYTFIQMITVISVLSYTIKFMFEEKVNNKLIFICLLIYAFIPIFPFYSISAFKDTYYATFFILFVLELYKMIKYKANKKNILMLIISSLLVCAFRPNGYITIMLSLLILLLLKLNRKQVLISILVITLVHLGYKQTLKYYEVAPTSVRETLSVPLQQTAALVVNNEDIIEEEDKIIIGKIIDYNKIKENYNPELSDPIKNTYNIESTKEDLMNYIKVWFKYLIKKPKTYIDATINNVYGYFYPDAQRWYVYYKKYSKLNESGFDYHYNSLEIPRYILVGYANVIQYIPLLNLTVSIGFTTWIYLILLAILIKNNHKKYIVLITPAFLTILMCLVGPVNLYYRYVIPYSESLPLVLMLLYNEKVFKKKEDK